jgi:outer membrane protein insertion porin family
VQARLGEPRISYTDGKSGFFSKKPVKFMKLDIPVTEGPQYRVGEVKFEGLTVFKEEFLRTFFKQEPGDVYNEGKLKKGFDKVRDLYGSVGYFQWTGGPRKKPDPVRKVVDVTLFMEEDKRYYVGRINFTGNDSTRDKVIRREVYMNEGDVFNTEALRASIRRVNQLGYFKPISSPPELRPNLAEPEKIDVTLQVEEQNRNQFTFGGGFSGLEGGFVNASFSTANFLGKGETLSLTAQSGQRTRNFELAVSEPYFLDRPITAGGAVFSRRLVYPTRENALGYTRQDQGFSLRTGVPTSRSSRAFLAYGFQQVDISDVDQDFLADAGLPPSEAVGRRFESRLTPSWIRNTVDNPFQPRRGSRLSASLELVGGPLQGTVNYWSPTVEAVWYRPVGKRMALGLRGEVAYAKAFGPTATLPYYRRYLLGGENQVRGFDPGTISPTDPETGVAIGGNKFALANAEYYFDVAGPLRLLLFFDAGEAAAEGQSLSGKGLRTSTGLEARFTLPVLNVPLRLIWSFNPNRAPGEPKTSFRFAIGTTF